MALIREGKEQHTSGNVGCGLSMSWFCVFVHKNNMKKLLHRVTLVELATGRSLFVGLVSSV